MNARRGMVWIELMAALAVMALVSLAGMRALGLLLEQHARSAAEAVQQAWMDGLEERLRRVWDQRCAHPFQREPGPWLVIEGGQGDDGLRLECMEILMHGPDGKQQRWILAHIDGGWAWQVTTATGPARAFPALGYVGPILLDIPAGEWGPGQAPPAIHWRFPDALPRGSRTGFAIHPIW
jgi:hypothetical protein